MEIFAKLFGSLLALVYHCFDRIVIFGPLALLTRPENIVHFFCDIHQVKTISKEVLRQRTDDLPPLGGSLRPQTSDPPGVGRQRSPHGGLRPSPPATPGAPPSVGSLLHPEEHGTGTLLPLRRSQVPGRRSPLPHPRPAAFPLHPTISAISRRGTSAGTDLSVTGCAKIGGC